MNAARHEIVDLFGLRHRPGCAADKVIMRPAIIRPGFTYMRCERCGAIGTVPDDDGSRGGD